MFHTTFFIVCLLKMQLDLTEHYLKDLTLLVDYGNGPRQKVYNINYWKCIKPFSKTGSFIDLDQALLTKKVWLISDLHLGHKNIIKYSERPYASVNEMNETLVRNIQSVAGADDIIVFGGDIAFMETEKANSLIARCLGYKILIIGNHDFNKGKLRDLDFDEIHLCKSVTYKGKEYALTHYPLDEMPDGLINIHGHTHNRNTGHPRHINISCEVINYTPITFQDLIGEFDGKANV